MIFMKYIITFFIAASLSSCDNKSAVKSEYEGKLLPSFNLLLMDSTTKINTKNIPTGQPIVLFFFSPICPYCRAQTEEIVDNMNTFTNVKFYFLSIFPLEQIKKYYDHYDLQKYHNITVGQDYDIYFGKYFKASGVPYTAIYDKNKKLTQLFIGKMPVSEMKKLALY
jgi:peroxiredoxin